MEEGIAHECLSNGDIRGKFKWQGDKEAFQTGQTSWDLPASSHWLPDLGQIPAAEWRVFLRAVSPPDQALSPEAGSFQPQLRSAQHCACHTAGTAAVHSRPVTLLRAQGERHMHSLTSVFYL